MKKYFVFLLISFLIFTGYGASLLSSYNASIKLSKQNFIANANNRIKKVSTELQGAIEAAKATLAELEQFYEQHNPEEAALKEKLEKAAASHDLLARVELMEEGIKVAENKKLLTMVQGRFAASLCTTKLNNMLAHSRVAANSVLLLIDENENIVFHPGRILEDNHLSLKEYAAKEEIASLSLVGSYLKNNRSGVIDLYADDSKELMWGFVQPIENTKLSLLAIALKTPVLKPHKRQQQLLFSGIIAIILGLSVISLAFTLKLNCHQDAKAWYTTSAFSAVMLLGTVALCLFSHNHLDYSYENEVPITEPSILESFLSELDIKATNQGLGATTKIPTGIFVNTIEIESAVNIRISGIIWQKFDLTAPPVAEGIYFPDATNVILEEIYNQTNNNVKTLGYSFDIVMRESFSGIRYPFDVEAIWIRMLPKEFYKNVILTPEFDDYGVVAPELMPGVDKNLILPSWKLKKSFFSYLTYNYNTNFGLVNSIGLKSFPELYFNVTAQRNFLDPFLSIILPLIVVAVLVFILLLTCSCDESKFEKLGFSAGAVLSGIAALFFVVIIAQIDLRKNIAAEQIIYVDFYYFVIYMVFLLVSINSLLICWPQKYKLLCRSDNLIVKTLYWPFISTTLFVATIFYFYP
jgi:hypothetical protein